MSTSALAEWVLIQAEGKSWLGKPSPGWTGASMAAAEEGRRPQLPLRLSPVYEYSLLLVPTPQGPQMQPNLRPPFGCMSVRSLALPGAAIWISIGDLARDEQKVFEQLVHATEEAIGRARAQTAGIVVAPAGTKIPDSFGGGPRK